MSLVCSSALLSLTRLLSSTIIGWRGLISNMRLLFMNSNLLWSAKAWLFITFSICAVQP